MLVHSLMAGASAFLILNMVFSEGADWTGFLKVSLIVTIAANLVVMAMEFTTTHPTEDAKRTVKMILNGRYRTRFWVGSILLGNLIPLALLLAGGGPLMAIGGLLVLIGIYITEDIWVEAPQRIPLS